MKTKVFCIGFHKTGTSTLDEALKILGYRVIGARDFRSDPNVAQTVIPKALELVPQYDAFQDNPWPIIYKELDLNFPNSKFILLLRDPDSWIKSQVSYFGVQESPMRKWIYGVGWPEGNEAIYLKRFNDHNREVQEYFKERPQDLLVMDLAKGEGWDKLCPFLGLDIPNEPFPHANKSKKRGKTEPFILKLLRKAKKSVILLGRRLTGRFPA